MAKIGIIRCDARADTCAGFSCFLAVREHTGAFSAYGDTVEIIGFDTCGGCDRSKADKITSRAGRLKEKGADVIHFGKCLISVCPWTDLFADSISQQIKIPVVRGTH
jgi:predicted metal-binding protein